MALLQGWSEYCTAHQDVTLSCTQHPLETLMHTFGVSPPCEEGLSTLLMNRKDLVCQQVNGTQNKYEGVK